MPKNSLVSRVLEKAVEDFRYFLNRGYPRKPALEWVGNRYGLLADQRQLLHRGVFSDADSTFRLKRIVPIKSISGKDLAIDGYNVLITVEAGLSRRPLVLGDDGFVRDISGLSGNFRRTAATGEVLRLILDLLRRIKPRHTLFLFDSPISRSGKLAEEIRCRLREESIPGDGLAIKVPEQILIGFSGIVATSDTAIIDRSKQVVDLAGHLLKRKKSLESLVRWGKRGTLGEK